MGVKNLYLIRTIVYVTLYLIMFGICYGVGLPYPYAFAFMGAVLISPVVKGLV